MQRVSPLCGRQASGILVYFAAFGNHIGPYPPVSGDARVEKAVAPYAVLKVNLKFRLDRPVPYTLIRRIVLLLLLEVATLRIARRRRH